MLSVLIFSLSVLLTPLIASFLGYWVHRFFHQPWALWLYNAHMNHHKIQYPPTDFYSEEYRKAGKDSTTLLFVIISIPLVVMSLVLVFFSLLSLTTLICFSVNIAIWGLLHNYFHDQFHLKNSYWNKFKWFNKLVNLHYVHHLELYKNFGILFFVWDKAHKTFTPADSLDLPKGN